MSDWEEIQAANTTEARRRSLSELARIAAAGRGWRFAWDGALLDDQGREIAPSIEEAARAMVALGWLRATTSNFVEWNAVPHVQRSAEAAEAVRSVLASNAKPDRLPQGGADELVKLLDLTEAELSLLRTV